MRGSGYGRYAHGEGEKRTENFCQGGFFHIYASSEIQNNGNKHLYNIQKQNVVNNRKKRSEDQRRKQKKHPRGYVYDDFSRFFHPAEDEKEKAMAKGKTLNEESALIAQDEEFFKNAASDFMPVSIDEKSGGIKNALSREDMDSYVEYAYKVSDIAAKQLCEGVIVPSPAKEACKYCDYKAMCKSAFVGEREERTVTSKTIIDAVKGGAENGELD